VISVVPARFGLVAVGSAVPARVVTNEEISRRVDTSDAWIVERTGIRERRVSGDDEFASDLATRAAEIAIDRAGIAPAEIDLIMTATTSPDAYFPSVSAVVADRVGAHAAAASDIAAACSGFVYALVTAAAQIQAGLAQNALVIGSDTLSKLIDWDDRSTCILFGDGAGAAVLSAGAATGRPFALELGADGSRGDDLYVRALRGGGVIQMNGREVFRFATRAMVDSVQRVLAAAETSIDEVDWFIPHQANSRIIDHAVKRLEADPAKVLTNLERYGNTSAGSIPLVLDEAWSEGKLRPGDRILMVGFGGGLTWGACLMDWAGPARPGQGV
jgi:3-oxoacyl-[acyl-carrier-protein] synthase III